MSTQPVNMQVHSLIDKFRPPIIKLRAVHSKNPYIVQQHRPLLPEEKYKQKTLDGYYILKESNTQLPSEVVTLNLIEKNITKIDDENFQYFSNLIELNLSHNHLNFSQSFAKFENLEILNLQGNNLTNINTDLTSFQKLRVLNLSFNFLQNIDQIMVLGELKELNINDNFIKDIPTDLSEFYLLESFNLSGNQFSSEHQAAEFFQSLATIQLLKYLYIARNQFKGFHTEKLKQGDFQNLEVLDIGYNQVDNQHNLICVRNFQNLRKVTITGNPFAEAKETEGLQVELNQRNGAQLENELQQKNYLKKIAPLPKKIQFSNMVLLQNHVIKKNGKIYNLGVKLAKVNKVRKTSEHQSDLFQEEEEQEDGMFLTGTNDVMDKKPRRVRSSKSFTNYDHFKQQANEILGGQKVYDNQLQIKQQYKMLKNMIQKQNSIDEIDQNEKNYLKPTKASLQQRVQNDDSQTELNIVNHEKVLNQKLENLEKEINNSLDEIQ